MKELLCRLSKQPACYHSNFYNHHYSNCMTLVRLRSDSASRWSCACTYTNHPDFPGLSRDWVSNPTTENPVDRLIINNIRFCLEAILSEIHQHKFHSGKLVQILGEKYPRSSLGGGGGGGGGGGVSMLVCSCGKLVQ